MLFEDLDIKFNANFGITDEGYLKPVVYQTDLKWGRTDFYHENWFVQAISFNTIKYAMVMIQNACYFMGEYIFTGMIEPVLTEFMNNYQWFIVLPSLFKGQNQWDYFVVDIKNTQAPYIGEGYMDFYVVGDLGYRGSSCGNMIQNDGLSFYRSTELSQLVITQSEANCIANQFAKSDLAHYNVNEVRFNQMFMSEGIKLDTSSLSQHIKIFEEKMGPNQPMRFDVKFKDFAVQFGEFDVDIFAEYTMMVGFYLDVEGAQELMYDEFRFQTAMNIRAENDIVHIDLTENKLVIGKAG